jgi:crotonobetainyl-CoA:carnitine CoA-transferase CaiB-like acyl-CoA transferase
MSATAPLTGVRVVDLTQIIAGPTCTYQLACLGADVIRVERPGGDSSWLVMPCVEPDGELHDTRSAQGIPLGHMKRGRGKRSVVLDLKTSGGIDRLRLLVAEADVVVENLRPGVLDRLGVGYANLSARNPGLVWCATQR